jgi:hypothetical protein
MRRHKHAERSVVRFAAVILIAGVYRITRHESVGWPAILIGSAMLVVTEWVVWRR